MKFFRYTLAAAATVMALGFTACSDDDDYMPGQPSDGVYFPSNQATTVNMETASTGFTVTVARSGLTEAATYNLVSSVTSGGVALDAEHNPFTLPASVSFAEGANTATVEVACSGADLVTGEPYAVSLGLAEGTPGFNYGSSTMTFTVTRLAAWGEWRAYGDGLATYNYALGVFSGLQGDDPDLPISIRDNTENPDLHQFWVEHWAFNLDLYLTWDSKTNLVTIAPQLMGGKFNVTGLGELDAYIVSLYPYFSDSVEDTGSFFNPETGEFELAVAYAVINPANGQLALLEGTYGLEYMTCGKYGDTSISFSYDGTLTDPDGQMSAQFTANIGADASKAAFAVSSELDANGLLQAMLAGSVPVVEATPGEGVKVAVPVSAAGEYTAVGISYGEDGSPANAVYTTFEVIGGGSGASWKTVATVDFIDGWVMPFFGFKDKQTGEEVPYTELGWQVKGQENTEKPGLYRLKSPWTHDDCVLVYLEINENHKATDLYIDATNPQCVKVYPQYSGVTVTEETGQTEFYVGNLAGYYANQGVDDATLISKGLNEVMEEGFIQINPALIGWSLEDFGYSHRDEPTTEIFFDFASGAGAPAKVKAARKNVTVSAQRFQACIRSNFRVPVMRHGKRTLVSGDVDLNMRNAFRYKIK